MSSPTISAARPQSVPTFATTARAESPAPNHADDSFAYAGAPNRFTRAYSAVRRSGIGRYLNRPGLIKPLATGVTGMAITNALPGVLTVALDGGLKIIGANTCEIGSHLWSKWGQNAGIAGAVLGLVMGGEVARRPADIEERMQGAAYTAVGATVVGQTAQLIYRGSQYAGQNTGHEFLCLMPEVPGYNLLFAVPVAVLIGAVVVQAGSFARSVARPDDEEANAA